MRLCYIGSGIDLDRPLSGWRRRWFEFSVKHHSLIICILFGYKVTHKFKHERQVDYSKYLGPNWTQNTFKGKRVSTIVSNHVGAVDIFTCASSGSYCSFTPDVGIRKFMGLGKILVLMCEALQCIYVDRGGSKEHHD